MVNFYADAHLFVCSGFGVIIVCFNYDILLLLGARCNADAHVNSA